MGNRNTKSTLRNAIVLLNISADETRLNDEKFWAQIWTEDSNTATEVIESISLQEVRMLRDGSPRNFACLIYKMVELLYRATGTLCNTNNQQTAVIIAARILIRLLPCVFEDQEWKTFFIDNKYNPDINLVDIKYPKKQEKNFEAYLPKSVEKPSICSITSTTNSISEEELLNLNIEDSSKEIDNNLDYLESNDKNDDLTDTLLQLLVISICDLLFCPEFTVLPRNDNNLISNTVDAPPIDIKSLSSCEYVWEPGVGFDSNSNSTTNYDKSRAVLLKLLLTAQSEILYVNPQDSASYRSLWTEILVSSRNRHVLPIFTSLLNTVFIYNPNKLTALNRMLFEDNREEVVELSLQILIAALDYKFNVDDETKNEKSKTNDNNNTNLFIEYLLRIHRGEDFNFLIKGFVRLLNSCLEQSYLLNPTKGFNFHQELLILFWRLSNSNSKFMTHLLNSNYVLDIVVPILHHLNENFQDKTKTSLIHIGVFNLLILSGERNFGVKLNKSYSANVLLNLPPFTGTHADLLIIVFHKLILYGYCLNQLFDYMITIIVNISPYLKALSILASSCIIQLFEIFSSPMVIFTEPRYHRLVPFLLEIFNNLIQYQFDGNTNMVYVILKHKEAFLNLSAMPCSKNYIDKILNKLIKKKKRMLNSNIMSEIKDHDTSIDNESNKCSPSSSSTLNQVNQTQQDVKGEVTLPATPSITQVTHPIQPFNETSGNNESQGRTKDQPIISFDHILNDQSSNVTDKVESIDFNDLYDTSFTESTGKQEYKWRPTPDWVKGWKQTLPLQTMVRMIEVLVPQVEQFKEGNKQQDDIEIIRFLQNGTLVGLLPVPHPIVIRKYQTNNATTVWFKTCTWGTIYIRRYIWSGTEIKLIKII